MWCEERIKIYRLIISAGIFCCRFSAAIPTIFFAANFCFPYFLLLNAHDASTAMDAVNTKTKPMLSIMSNEERPVTM